MFSKACEYAIRAVIFIADKSSQGERANLHEIANGINSPVAFTAKILQKLAKGEIIISTKGPRGGFEITNRKINKTSLAEIVITIDGRSVLTHCVLGLEKCTDSHPCPVHHKFLPIRNDLVAFLHQTLLKDVVTDLSMLNTFIKP
ncbi:MAG: Rrf2 family transcriptional regulator [Bacteroidetes bacterium]|nr:Rrf2 family transcriptional regulator [Bacteroidota bacterium]